MENNTPESGGSFMEKLSTFIVDKRNLIYLIVVLLIIFSMFSPKLGGGGEDLTAYLPDSSETKKALDVMEDQFITYGTAQVMVANITQEEAAKLHDTLKEIKGCRAWTMTRPPTTIITFLLCSP